MSIEKPCQPSPEEIKKAEEMMTPEQEEKSEERGAAFEAGYKEKNKEDIIKVIKSLENLKSLNEKVGCLKCIFNSRVEFDPVAGYTGFTEFMKPFFDELSIINITKEDIEKELSLIRGCKIKLPVVGERSGGANQDICFIPTKLPEAVKNILSKREKM